MAQIQDPDPEFSDVGPRLPAQPHTNLMNAPHLPMSFTGTTRAEPAELKSPQNKPHRSPGSQPAAGLDAPPLAPINISSVPENKAGRCRQCRWCHNCLVKNLRGWSPRPLLNYWGNQIYAGALQGDRTALGDSDKPAGKIPSEMQKRCTGEKMLLIITDENGLLIGCAGWGGTAERLQGPRAGMGRGGFPHGLLSFSPRTRVPGVLSSSGNTAVSSQVHRQPVMAW